MEKKCILPMGTALVDINTEGVLFQNTFFLTVTTNHYNQSNAFNIPPCVVVVVGMLC